MCFSNEQHPPLPPKTSEVRGHGPAELTAVDGNAFRAYDATPVARRGASLVLLPDIRGLHPYYTDLALAFATAGIDTVALDPFGRTAGLGARDDDFDYMPHAKSLTSEQVLSDSRAAAARLRDRSDDPVFTLGFCKFGGESWLLAASDLGASGCMGFYGQPGATQAIVDRLASPLLILAAGADQATSREDNAAFDRALNEAGKEHEYAVYEEAPHSFFDRSFGDWASACDDAWVRMLGFIERYR